MFGYSLVRLSLFIALAIICLYGDRFIHLCRCLRVG